MLPPRNSREGRAGRTANRMDMMKRNSIAALAAVGLGVGAAALAGCGSSQTKTVTVVSGPAVTHSTQTTAPPTTSSASTPASTTPATTGTAGGTAAPGATHTASEPEFTQQESHAAGVGEALAVLQARGYTASESSQYHPNQTLRVLVGTKTGSSDG